MAVYGNSRNGGNVTEQGFEGLQFHQDSFTLLRAAYRLADKLPEYERYNLSDRMRRAVTSVVLNIAEGYGRYHYLDRVKFRNYCPCVCKRNGALFYHC
jgi:hypothetical protein